MPKVSTPSGGKKEVKVAAAPVVKKQPTAKRVVASHPASMKTVRNVSLQAWSVFTGNGYHHLTPGKSIQIAATSIDQRLVNLQARRLVTISQERV